jgi:hypothetical protein
MPTEKQVLAILSVLATSAALGFALWNLYVSIKQPNAYKVTKA